jgi:hypothetical protein
MSTEVIVALVGSAAGLAGAITAWIQAVRVATVSAEAIGHDMSEDDRYILHDARTVLVRLLVVLRDDEAGRHFREGIDLDTLVERVRSDLTKLQIDLLRVRERVRLDRTELIMKGLSEAR